MPHVQNGRFTADLSSLGDDVIVFLIGMRINKPWKVHAWWPVFVAMPTMLRYLAEHPDKGLLGGMTEVPGSDWHAGQEDKAALQQAPELKGIARWHRKAGVVTHVFTHFPLELVIYTARVPARTRPPEGMRWVPIATLAGEALPNVMRKAIAHGLG